MSGKFNKQYLVHFIAVFSGKIGASGLGFLVSLAMARFLGPEKFGLFSFFLIWAQIGSCFVGDIFADALIRNYAESARANPPQTGHVLLNALVLRLFFGITLVASGAIFSEDIALQVFNNPAYIDPIRYGCLGALAISLWTFSLSTLQASESFIKHGLLSPLVNVLRLTAIPVLFEMAMFTVQNLILVFVGSYFFGGVASILSLTRRFKHARLKWTEIKKQLNFSKWITVSLICLVFINFLAIPALGFFADDREVGIYAAGANLLLVFEHITNALITIQYPKMSRLTESSELRRFLWKSFKLSLLIVVSLTPVFYFIEPIILAVYGTEYAGSAVVFQILFAGMLTTMITQPLNLLFLVLNKSYYWGTMSIISLLFWLASCYFLVPVYAAVGAAAATLVARIVYSLISAGLLWKTLRFQLK